MKITQIEKLKQLVSRTDMTGNQKTEWLTKFIDDYVTDQLRLNDVKNTKELIIDFLTSLEIEGGNRFVSKEWIADNYLQTNN
jgi:hypothetical protein